ncbi:MAG: hypothetical protein UT12_C0002G0002 [Candidatus Curtissbacteria bacterium GW2011_GWC2_38_9]|uniref:Uncharacterized protein n=3 Tax=Candidatus Curtissiibacteriota TaxID=1752717 RepID=A0A1F5HRG9_9BACT|nr:MAG: hypothetical protein UT12_C0002G0002 [Candidatus Curtissbacteria bacterium GW2011_GWC2_38_9]KKS04616.1 MAG: hypothetical protein UU56_C0004G0017 [Candidatus Curtissbacteria bacterium GW2011_GWA2_41_24]OGD89726.1 MAG: hypothetical protein A2Z54_01010 [Candidatus Curtissbacteria bacterium RIFCSPHIGHO2_02_39_8]OGE06742.1 MAG: hypothetical protein A2W70_04810 [Candidatus Curtissbacteria bacterium RIFCSPLOWO2_02_41_11]
MNAQKQLARFLSFHLHPHSSSYNTIEGIISPTNVRNQIRDLFSLLNVDYAEVTHEEKNDVFGFLQSLAEDLSKGKVIVVFANSVNFDPVIYDQLIKLRESNKFDIHQGSFDLRNTTIPSQAKIFLVTNESEQNTEDKMREITDHLLDLRKVS